MDGFAQQLRLTIRKLLRAPFFTGVAVLTLAVGIGANAAIFSVVNGVLLKPLPFENPEELVGIWHTAPGLGFPRINQSPALHFYYSENNRTFESVGMWDDATASVTGLDEPEQVAVMTVTYQTLPLLGVHPQLGRSFTEADDTPDAPLTVLLSHGYWDRAFGSDPSVLGRTLTVSGRSREIIGVLPEETRFLRSDPDIYLPFQFDRTETFVGNFSYQAVGRLAPGATIAQANADIERMVPLAVDAYPGGITHEMLAQAQFGSDVRELKYDVVGDIGNVLWVLLGTVGIVLLIACANVANLILVRAEGRQQEMAVRTAMGAGRADIAGQLVLESVVLAVVGGAFGLVLAYGGIRVLVGIGPESLPRLSEIGIAPVVVLFTGATSILAGLLFGALPVIRFGRGHLVGALKEGGRGGSAGRERQLARNALVVAQMALALVLLAGSGLMVRSFQALRSVDPGFEAPEEVLTFRVNIPQAEIEEGPQAAQAYREMLRRVQAIPGVARAAITTSATMDGWDSNDALEAENDPVAPGEIAPIRRYKWIGSGYFETMGNQLLAGRDITPQEIENRTPVVVITEDLARAHWNDPADAIGRRVRQSAGEIGTSPWFEVVGVVAHVYDDGVSQDPVPIVYWPQEVDDFWGEGYFTQRSMRFVIRAAVSDPNSLLPAAREAVWSVNPNLPIASVRTLDEIAANSMARTSFTLVMLGIAAVVALFLGVVGIYGVISYIVSQRTREIGVRMAMGAEMGDVRRMVLRQALALTGGGVVVGLLAAAGLTRLMAALLYGVSPMDPMTFGSVAAGLSTVALAASWIPARRAARVDPVVALRAEI